MRSSPSGLKMSFGSIKPDCRAISVSFILFLVLFSCGARLPSAHILGIVLDRVSEIASPPNNAKPDSLWDKGCAVVYRVQLIPFHSNVAGFHSAIAQSLPCSTGVQRMLFSRQNG